MGIDSIIKINDFKKLKQLDRVELLLRLDRLEKSESNSHFCWSNITNVFCVFTLFLLLISIIDYRFIQITFKGVVFFISISIFIAFVGSIYNIFNRMKYKKLNINLEEEYFIKEVKKR